MRFGKNEFFRRLKGGPVWYVLGATVALWPLFFTTETVLPGRLQDSAMVFLSVVLEATPFLLLGALVSAGVRRSSSVLQFIRHFPTNPVLGVPLAALLGVALPVCECGNVPIARSLVARGLSTVYATVFLFSAPLLNPAVVFSTVVAFGGNWTFVILRFALGLVVIISLGWWVWWQDRHGVSLWRRDDSNAHGACDHEGVCEHETETFAGRVIHEFMEIFPLLVFGALATPLVQAFVPREVFSESQYGHAGAILFMMLLAFILSVCSSSDAFIALGYTGLVPPSALLAFLIFGPMIDAKNVLLYGKIFSLRGILRMSAVIAALVFVVTLCVDKLGLLPPV